MKNKRFLSVYNKSIAFLSASAFHIPFVTMYFYNSVQVAPTSRIAFHKFRKDFQSITQYKTGPGKDKYKKECKIFYNLNKNYI